MSPEVPQITLRPVQGKTVSSKDVEILTDAFEAAGKYDYTVSYPLDGTAIVTFSPRTSNSSWPSSRTAREIVKKVGPTLSTVKRVECFQAEASSECAYERP